MRVTLMPCDDREHDMKGDLNCYVKSVSEDENNEAAIHLIKEGLATLSDFPEEFDKTKAGLPIYSLWMSLDSANNIFYTKAEWHTEVRKELKKFSDMRRDKRNAKKVKK